MKTLLKLLLLFGVIVYLVFAFTAFSGNEDMTACRKVNFVIADSAHAGFITTDEAERILRKSGAYPIGQTMSRINGLEIEKLLLKNSFIESAQCYKSPNGVLNILIEQRLPVMRILADNGENYYIDSHGHTMQPQGYVADLVVATGKIDKRFAQTRLLALGTYIKNNPFWEDQIEQVFVEPNHHVQLVPRVGGHIIHFGTTDSLETKFRNLYTFYQKVLPDVGWNKYAEISVENTSQVVGKKHHK